MSEAVDLLGTDFVMEQPVDAFVAADEIVVVDAIAVVETTAVDDESVTFDSAGTFAAEASQSETVIEAQKAVLEAQLAHAVEMAACNQIQQSSSNLWNNTF